MNPLVGIFRTNVLPLGPHGSLQGSVASEGGIFLVSSRFNSSCIPNVDNYWCERTSSLRIVAQRDILVGEELCIDYTELFSSREARRASLRKNFGFDCACEICSLDGDARAESDKRRLELMQLYEDIGMMGGAPRRGINAVSFSFAYMTCLFIYIMISRLLLHPQGEKSSCIAQRRRSHRQ